MKVLIGTPPVETLAIADTGRDLTWIQCTPCKRCFEHKYPFFDLQASSSYKTLKCTSKQCKASEGYTVGPCTCKHSKCQYNVTYGDKSYSNGHLATETLTFGKTLIERYVFGCGHNNRVTFGDSSSGIIGLGGGPLSIIVSWDKHSVEIFLSISKNETNTINFGKQSQVSSSKAVSTPFFQTSDQTYYYLYLEKVIIGNKSFEYPREETGASVQTGNIIIDSGTPITFLPGGDFYDGIVSTLKEAMGVETIDDPDGMINFCYKTDSDVKAPTIAFQSKDATINIPQSSAFVEVDDGVTCFTVVPNRLPFHSSIFGNVMQENFLVSYDLRKRVVSFQATDCSKKF